MTTGPLMPLSHQVSVYLPADWRQALASGQKLPEDTQGTALFADISGFTPLTEALTRSLGLRRGAEELPRYLNQIYDTLIREVDRFTGTVIGFAGDAITCWFADDLPSLPGFDASHPPEPAELRATACAFAMQTAMRQFAAIPVAGQAAVALAIKVAIASGPAHRFIVGNPQIQMIPVLAGETLARMAAAEHQAQRGEVILDARTAARLEERITITAWRAEAESGERFAVAAAFNNQVAASPWLPLEQLSLREDQIQPWVQPRVYARHEAGLGEFLTELRPAVALFMRFNGIDYDQDHAAGPKLDAYIRWVQKIISQYDGTFLQLTIGDKGSYLYAAFGAPSAHEDETLRAVSTALALREIPAELSYIQPVQIGISRGMMRTGAYGGSTRRTYGVLGDQVNLSARLMAFAAPGQVIVNQTVQQTVADDFTWELLAPIRVKGKSDAIAIARLLAKAIAQKSKQHIGPIVGRQAEIAQLESTLNDVARGHCRVCSIEGEAGIGKTRLVDELTARGQQNGWSLLRGSGQSIEPHTPYRAWREVFETIFKGQDHAQIQDLVKQLAPEHLKNIPLLNDILHWNLPESEQTLALEPAQRQERLISFLLALLGGWASRKSLILVIDDAQWLDSLSWKLVQQLARETDYPIFLIVVTRPLADDPVAQANLEVVHAARPGQTGNLLLEPLSASENLAVAASRLGVAAEHLPPQIAALVQTRTEGNPFFAEQLVLALLEQNLVQVVGEGLSARCEVQGDLSQASGALPDTIQGLILARIDQLPLDQQLVLKVAAVIGRTFTYSPLNHTLQQHVEISEAALTAHLGALDARDLASLQVPILELTYIFKHLIIQDLAYETMSYAQRRRLHADLARWYESIYTADLSPVYALLAHHWERAENAAKAAHYLLLAGDESRRLYALPEAIVYYQSALAYLRDGTNYEQTARTLMKLGLTYHLAFDFRKARQAYEEGFTLWQQANEVQQNTLDFPLLERPFKADWPYLPLTLDPALAGDIDTVGVLDQLYSGLVSLGVGLDVMPEVANRWEILEDGLKYVFCLRKDVRWCDGTPLTAADFETAWKRVLDPALESPVASTLYDICGARAYHQGENPDPQSVAVQALDDHTLLVTLEQPTSYFLYLMTFSAAYPIPRHLLESKGASWADSENLVTNGPFKLETWQQENDQDGTLSLVRNPAYQGRFSGNLQRVDLTALPTCEARLAAYENGQLDTLSFRNLSGDRDRIRQAHAGEYLSVPFLATTYLIFDATRPPLDDARLRQALVMAIDREQHADVNLNGFSFPALGGFVPPGMPGHSGEIGIPFDPERARGLLAESGFGVGHPQPEIEFLAGPDQESILNFLTEQWQNHLGISIPGKSADWETFVNRLEANPPHIFLNIWVNDYPDPDNFLRASKPLEWSRWQDANYQKLVETARQIPDQAQRMALYQQADQILVDAAVIVPFNYWRSHLLVNPEVKRYPTSAIKWWYFKDVVAE